MATATNTIICDYDYMDEAQIDSELKCPICIQPFQKPATISCQHTFCQHCIEAWLKSHTSCPTCRQKRDRTAPFSPVRTRIVINQLDRLLVRCRQCQQINIQRGDLLDHQSKCPKMLVPCSSADIQCPWMGPRDEQANHIATCSFQQLRPIFISLQVELRKQSSQISFLCALINKGNFMRPKCEPSSKICQYSLASRKETSKIFFRCVLCKQQVRKCHVSLHTCPSNSACDCICDECHDQYCSLEDDDDEEDNEDEEDSNDDNDDDG